MSRDKRAQEPAEQGATPGDEHEEGREARPKRPSPRRVRERERHGGASPEEDTGAAPEDPAHRDPDRGLGQIDKRERVPGKERGERPQDTGTYTDSGGRGN